MKNYFKKKHDESERPPVFKTWNHWYIIVIINLVFLVLLFFIFTKFFE